VKIALKIAKKYPKNRGFLGTFWGNLFVFYPKKGVKNSDFYVPRRDFRKKHVYSEVCPVWSIVVPVKGPRFRF
jgi:hypothetical protein